MKSCRIDGPERLRSAVFAILAMLAFAANSLLCRLAFQSSHIDAASFTAIRITSGAVVLALILIVRGEGKELRGSWFSALALALYAAAFSFAYLKLPTAVGALLLFGAVQATMIGYGFWRGERLHGVQIFGLIIALAGLIVLLFPWLTTPPLLSSILMLAAGIAWGIGYILWYSALPALSATNAATIQLSVPVLAALGGVLFLGEAITWRLVLSSAGILGGVALVILCKGRRI